MGVRRTVVRTRAERLREAQQIAIRVLDHQFTGTDEFDAPPIPGVLDLAKQRPFRLCKPRCNGFGIRNTYLEVHAATERRRQRACDPGSAGFDHDVGGSQAEIRKGPFRAVIKH